MAISPPNFPPLEVHLDGTAGLRWKKWLGWFERLAIRMGISDDKQKRALLLHYGGPEVDEIFDTLQDVGEDKDYKKAVGKQTAHFSPQVKVTYEVYNFQQAKKKVLRNSPLFPHTSEKPSEDLRFRKSRQRNQRTDHLELWFKFPTAQSSARRPRLIWPHESW